MNEDECEWDDFVDDGPEEVYGYVDHPLNGRKVRVISSGYHEGDTGAWIERENLGYPRFDYVDNGDEIDTDELNTRVETDEEINGIAQTYHLHEWLLEKADW